MTEWDWHTDWLYAVIFREVDKGWDEIRQHSSRPNAIKWGYILVEEWSSAVGPECKGSLQRVWIRDENGLHEITVEEHADHKRKIQSNIFPFITMSFHIHADRQRVVLENVGGSMIGYDFRYFVHGEGETATLVEDRTCFWHS